tara:strand:+ start:111 stop:980 length:870 start_codon:yes stop_codon:yes gene_type:complete
MDVSEPPVTPTAFEETRAASTPVSPALLKGLEAATLGGSGPKAAVAATPEDVLQQQLAAMQAELCASRKMIGMWEDCMRQLAYSVMLSPDMNDIYKQTCTQMLRDALSSVEQVQRIIYVDASFPSVPAEAPHLSLQKWVSMGCSEWDVSFRPSWSIMVAIEGSHYLSFQLELKVCDINVSGRMRVAFATDPAFSKISISFLELPTLGIKTECTVSWGSTPLPIQEYIGSAVEDYFKAYITDTMLAPNAMDIEPASFQPKTSLTDDDVERAIRAVDLARSYSNALGARSV